MKYKNSLKIYQLVQIIREFWLGMLLSVIYFKFIGMGDFQISLFHIISAILLFLLEIPTGAFADKFGYKKSIIWGHIFLFFALFSYVIAAFQGYWVVLTLSALFFALYHSFISGADKAYLYLAFKIDNREDKYLSFNSKLNFYSKISKSLAVLTGAITYQINEILPYSVQAILILLAVFLLLFLEPIPEKYRSHIPNLLEHSKVAIKIFFSQKIFLALFTFILFSTSVFQFFNHLLNQSFWIEKGLSIYQIGTLGVGIFLTEGILGLTAPYLFKKFSEKSIFLFLAIFSLIIPFILSISNQILTITLFSGLMYALFSIINMISDLFIQKNIKNTFRASIKSVGNMFTSFFSRLLLVLVGGIILNFLTYSQTILYLGIIFGLLSIFTSFIFIKKHTN